MTLMLAVSDTNDIFASIGYTSKVHKKHVDNHGIDPASRVRG